MHCHVKFVTALVTLLYFIFPNGTLGHLGAALRAKAGADKSFVGNWDIGKGMIADTKPNSQAFDIEWEFRTPNENDDPAYIPYLGTQAMTNMPDFFQHLRENILSLSRKRVDSSSLRNYGPPPPYPSFDFGLRNGPFRKQKRDVTKSQLNKGIADGLIVVIHQGKKYPESSISNPSQQCRNIAM